MRIYVGLVAGSPGQRAIFRAAGEPTAAEFPQYGAAIGPFRTRRAAVLCQTVGNVPSLITVGDYERAARRQARGRLVSNGE